MNSAGLILKVNQQFRQSKGNVALPFLFHKQASSNPAQFNVFVECSVHLTLLRLPLGKSMHVKL